MPGHATPGISTIYGTPAGEDEMVFVLLGRDVAAAPAVRAWAKEHIERGKNKPEDGQIKEALAMNCTEL